jgi:hypothetical protein
MPRAFGVFMDKQVFSDGIGQVSIIGGTARLDFVIFSPTEKDAKGQPVAVFNQRIVMSLDGFMQSAAKIQEAALAVSKLVQRAREGQSADAAAAAVAAAPSPSVSPAAEAAPQKRPFP